MLRIILQSYCINSLISKIHRTHSRQSSCHYPYIIVSIPNRGILLHQRIFIEKELITSSIPQELGQIQGRYCHKLYHVINIESSLSILFYIWGNALQIINNWILEESEKSSRWCWYGIKNSNSHCVYLCCSRSSSPSFCSKSYTKSSIIDITRSPSSPP